MKKFLSLILVLIFAFGGCASNPERIERPERTPEFSEPSAALLSVHFMDVGQGDASFVEFPNGKTMLIDAGDAGRGEEVVSYVEGLGYSEVNFIVATHPHADHIGGMARVIDSFDVGMIFMPNALASTDVFESMLDAAEEKGLKIRTARAGVGIFSEPGLTAEILAPNAEKYGDLNNCSAVVKISYGETAFLFMGDAEMLSENEIVGDVRANVVKVGHHGSDSSSGPDFVARTKAEYAIVSAGAENAYGHPSPLTTKRWSDAGAKVYRTDENGTVVAVSDGREVMISAKAPSEKNDVATSPESAPDRPEESEAAGARTSEWVLNTGTKKIHFPDCRAAQRISPGNRAVSDKTVARLSEEGFTACGICKPHDPKEDENDVDR